MLEISAASLVYAANHLERLEVLISEWENPTVGGTDTKLSMSLRLNIVRSYENIARSAPALNAPLTGLAASRAAKKLRARKTSLDFNDLKLINMEIGSRLADEISAVNFYCLPPQAAAFYSPPEPLFGAEVAARMPDAADDISEAGKCFAVGRYTASAFHLMRAMETAVKALSAELQIQNVEREWGKLLSDIAKKIEPMPRGGQRDAWSQVHANLYHVKQAWRNSTMHPKRTYTEEEAREVFEAMKAFMRHLAGLLPPSVEEMLG